MQTSMTVQYDHRLRPPSLGEKGAEDHPLKYNKFSNDHSKFFNRRSSDQGIYDGRVLDRPPPYVRFSRNSFDDNGSRNFGTKVTTPSEQEDRRDPRRPRGYQRRFTNDKDDYHDSSHMKFTERASYRPKSPYFPRDYSYHSRDRHIQNDNSRERRPEYDDFDERNRQFKLSPRSPPHYYDRYRPLIDRKYSGSIDINNAPMPKSKKFLPEPKQNEASSGSHYNRAFEKHFGQVHSHYSDKQRDWPGNKPAQVYRAPRAPFDKSARSFNGRSSAENIFRHVGKDIMRKGVEPIHRDGRPNRNLLPFRSDSSQLQSGRDFDNDSGCFSSERRSSSGFKSMNNSDPKELVNEPYYIGERQQYERHRPNDSSRYNEGTMSPPGMKEAFFEKDQLLSYKENSNASLRDQARKDDLSSIKSEDLRVESISNNLTDLEDHKVKDTERYTSINEENISSDNLIKVDSRDLPLPDSSRSGNSESYEPSSELRLAHEPSINDEYVDKEFSDSIDYSDALEESSDAIPLLSSLRPISQQDYSINEQFQPQANPSELAELDDVENAVKNVYEENKNILAEHDPSEASRKYRKQLNFEEVVLDALNRFQNQGNEEEVLIYLRDLENTRQRKIQFLSRRYRKLMKSWMQYVSELEKNASKHADEPKNSENAGPVQPLVRFTRRGGGQNHFFDSGDAVQSEEEFLEILAALERQSAKESSKTASGCAVIPAMFLDELEKNVKTYYDQNRLVEDPLTFYHFYSSPDVWTAEEQTIFEAKFAEFPKQFGKIAKYLPEKDSMQCVLHYYRTKNLKTYRTRRKGDHAKRRKKSSSGRRVKKFKGSALMTDIAEMNDNDESDDNENDNDRSAESPAASVGLVTPESFRIDEEILSEDKIQESITSGTTTSGCYDEKPTTDLEPHETVADHERRNELFDAETEGPASLTERSRPSSYWSVSEIRDFHKLFRQHGSNFAAISSDMKSKTAVQVRNFFLKNVQGENNQDLTYNTSNQVKRLSKPSPDSDTQSSDSEYYRPGALMRVAPELDQSDGHSTLGPAKGFFVDVRSDAPGSTEEPQTGEVSSLVVWQDAADKSTTIVPTHS